MRISDWSSDVCSSDLQTRTGLLRLVGVDDRLAAGAGPGQPFLGHGVADLLEVGLQLVRRSLDDHAVGGELLLVPVGQLARLGPAGLLGVGGSLEHHLLQGLVEPRSEEHTSELQSLMRISYAVFCLNNKNTKTKYTQDQPQK